jgi:hypothetical protein
VSEGKAAHLGWVLAHPARVRRRARAARVFISPEAATAPIYSFLGGGFVHADLPISRPDLAG